MKWKVWADISRISGLDNLEKARAYADYLLRQSEYMAHISTSFDEINDRMEARRMERGIWSQLLELEKRIDSRLQTRIIQPLPNGLTALQVKAFMEGLREFFRRINPNLHVTIVRHLGKKKGRQELNSHLHVVFSERDKLTQKKDRDISRKNFFPNYIAEVKRLLQRWGSDIEIEMTPELAQRNRINRVVYHRKKRMEEIMAQEQQKLLGFREMPAKMLLENTGIPETTETTDVDTPLHLRVRYPRATDASAGARLDEHTKEPSVKRVTELTHTSPVMHGGGLTRADIYIRTIQAEQAEDEAKNKIQLEELQRLTAELEPKPQQNIISGTSASVDDESENLNKNGDPDR